MGLPTVDFASTATVFSATTTTTATRTVAAGASLHIGIAFATTGATVSIADTAGATYSQVTSVDDGTQICFLFECLNHPGMTSGTITITISASSTGRWCFCEVSGINSSTPRDTTSSFTATSAARTSAPCAAVGAIDTPANVFVMFAGRVSVAPGTHTAATGYTLQTPTNTLQLIGYRTSSGALTDSRGGTTFSSTTNALAGCIASWNGDNQGGGSSLAGELLLLGCGA